MAEQVTPDRPVDPVDPVEMVRSHVEHCMGTVFSFDLRDPVPRAVLSRVVADLHRADEVFSTYRRDSQVSRLGRGELTLEACDPEVGQVLGIGRRVERLTAGAFSLHADGTLDPSAVVKGWAVERAVTALVAAGAARVAVGGGGDVQVHDGPTAERGWRVGVADPHRSGAVVTTVHAVRRAVATSGTAERGGHVLDPRTGQPATALASLTLVGPRLSTVDPLATAAFVLGERGRDLVDRLGPGYGAFAVRPDGSTWQTSGFARWAGPVDRGLRVDR